MTDIVCAACPEKIGDKDSIRCSTCKDYYHSQCVNIQSKDAKQQSEHKTTWICPACQAKQPKGGDNSNTPIGKRSAATKSDAAPSDGVNVRSKPAKAPSSSQSNIDETNEKKKIAKQSAKSSQAPPPHKCLSKEDIREVIQTELKKILNAEVAKIITQSMSAVRTEVNVLKEEINSVKDSMQYMNDNFEEMKNECESKFDLCNQLRKEVETLKHNNMELFNRLNELEQQSRACNVEIQCVPEHKSENLLTTVLQLARTVSCDIKEDDIHLCTRTAKIDSNSSRPRNIIVKLKNPIMRDALLASVIKFNKAHKEDKLNSSHLGIGGDKKPVYVAEHLTYYNKQIHKAARLAAKEKQYKYVWIRSGRILVRKDDSAQAIVLKSLESVKRL